FPAIPGERRVQRRLAPVRCAGHESEPRSALAPPLLDAAAAQEAARSGGAADRRAHAGVAGERAHHGARRRGRDGATPATPGREPPLCCRAVRGWMVVAALAGRSAVAAGAFGAHGLRARVAPEQVASWQTAAHYQLLHAAVLLALASLADTGRALGPAPWLFTAGMLLF